MSKIIRRKKRKIVPGTGGMTEEELGRLIEELGDQGAGEEIAALAEIMEDSINESDREE